MARIDRASIGPSDFGPANVIVLKQPHGEVLEREGVKLRRILWCFVVAQVLTIAVSIYAAVCAASAAEYAARAASRHQLETPR